MNRLAFYIGIENLEEIKNMDNLYLKARLLVDLLFAEKKDKQENLIYIIFTGYPTK